MRNILKKCKFVQNAKKHLVEYICRLYKVPVDDQSRQTMLYETFVPILNLPA